MSKRKPLEDEFYDKQIGRMSNLAKFPMVPEAYKELRRALRRVSETDEDFIRKLISEVMDTNERCPTPAELIRRAGEIRSLVQKPVGSPDCEQCHGSGFVSSTRRVKVAGLAPYDADSAAACACRGGK